MVICFFYGVRGNEEIQKIAIRSMETVKYSNMRRAALDSTVW